MRNASLRKLVFLCALCVSVVILPTPSPQQAAFTVPDVVRVRLFSTSQPSEIRVTTADGQSILINSRQTPAPFRTGGPVTIQTKAGAPIHLEFPLEITADHGTLVIVNEIPFEEYVAAVLAGESSGFRSDEALKAMAVAVRTYGMDFLNRHEKEGFNFCDTTHCQDFRITAVTARLRKAANDTRGQVLMYNGKPISAYYHKDCGGVTEARGPYLQQLNDRFCTAGGRKRWSAALTAADVKAVIGVNAASSIEIVERTSSGRAQRLRISGVETHVMSAETFRLEIGRKIGWDKIRSDLYEIHNSEGRFLFEGFGEGHGVGLCQHGAAVMGDQGFTYEQILAYYYPNTQLTRLGI